MYRFTNAMNRCIGSPHLFTSALYRCKGVIPREIVAMNWGRVLMYRPTDAVNRYVGASHPFA